MRLQPAFLMALLVTPAAGAAMAQPSLIHRQTLQSRDVPAPTYRTELVRTTVDRGGLVARHTHPGLEIGYVEDGEARVEIEGQPVRALHRGDSFSVLAGTPHQVRNTGPGPLVVLSTYVVDRSKPLATPDP